MKRWMRQQHRRLWYRLGWDEDPWDRRPWGERLRDLWSEVLKWALRPARRLLWIVRGRPPVVITPADIATQPLFTSRKTDDV